MFRLVVYGNPVAQERARAVLAKGRVIVYDPARSREYKKYVREEALKVRPAAPLTGPLSLTVKAYLAVPKSFSKKKRGLALAGEIRPTTRPDLKNLIAGVEDALKGIVWRDDSQVVDFGESGKWYSDSPRIEVIVSSLKKGGAGDGKSAKD